MSAFSAAASDEDGDTIKSLRAAIEQARNWIAEHPDRRPISAGRMVAILTNALAAAPQPPAVEQPQDEQEPVAEEAYMMIDHFLRNNLADEDYSEFSDALEDIRTYAQPPRKPLTDEEIGEIEGWFSNEFGLEAKHSIDFARAIERAHGIGGEA